MTSEPIGDMLRMKVSQYEERETVDDFTVLYDAMVSETIAFCTYQLLNAELYQLVGLAERGIRECSNEINIEIPEDLGLDDDSLKNINKAITSVVNDWTAARRLTGLVEMEHDAGKNKLMFTVKLTW